METTNIIKWVKSLQGKSRFSLQYEGTGLYLQGGKGIIVADVYDDYLIFRLLDDHLDARDLFMIEIAAFNDCSATAIEMRISEAIDRVTNE